MNPKNAYDKIVKNKNWGMVMFYDSQSMTDESKLKTATKNFEKMAELFKGKITFTICDVYLEKTCMDLLELFELEQNELPMIRVLYAMSGQSGHHQVFRMEDSVYEEMLP